MLSRFDLIFVLLDRPDEQMDQMLSRHVMALHAGPRGSDRGAAQGQGQGQGRGGGAAAECPWEQEAGYEEWQQKQPLSLRLRQDAEQTEPVPGPLLRKYIAYARTYCHPVLGEKARAVLSAFYLQLRKTQRGGDSVPPRHAPHVHAHVHVHVHHTCMRMRYMPHVHVHVHDHVHVHVHVLVHGMYVMHVHCMHVTAGAHHNATARVARAPCGGAHQRRATVPPC